MRILDSLAGRVVVSLILLTVAFGLVAAGTGSITLHREINEAMDSSMQESARRLLPLVIDDLFGREPSQSPRRLAEAVSDDDGGRLIFQVRDAGGRVLIHSYDAPAEPLTAELVQGFSEASGWRIYTEPAVSGTVFIQVAELDARRNEETLEAATGFLIPMVILIPLSALVAWLTLARFLRPIATLRGEISARHGDNLAPIRTDDLPSELAAIAKSVNSLMRRLNMALDAEKEFTANAAHELRTPIAGALAQTERLIAEASDEAEKKRPRQIRAALSDLADLSEKLMQLARADAGVAVAGKPADLAAVAALVVEDFEQRGQNNGRLRLKTPDNGKALVAIDTDALAIILRNLIENALRHGTEGGEVVIRITDDARLSVVNQGPVVPAPDGLVKRFERGETRAEGSGLGLAIVNRILQQIGATLTLDSPASGQQDGFEATIRFPAA
ncbi:MULTISPECIES: ATP-binding protein [unclassified Mesorhizobium]|uniref:ATP-binding protein n=1 Tax=unclassified Mesorhizobium TaxID=325217 RepID=UPI00112CA15D|nr:MULTISPECIES: ATP-binding protein [unclassified Mesorhizobium]TPN45373.1 HAMP domain-containing protein [Mesorhizobium sp. B1-1-9]TPN46417.1 HAMP domain-containing protein [Mesorhizobium sp. B1-1-7]